MTNNIYINRNFFYLWLGQFISQLGDKVYAIALSWWILKKTGSPLLMGVMLTAALLPQILLEPVAGVFVDRFNRKTLLIVSDLIRGMIVFGIATLEHTGRLQPAVLIAGTIVLSLSSAFFDPSVKAIIPQIVEKEKLLNANALSQTVYGIATLAGPVLGAYLIGKHGYAFVFIANAISFILSGLLEALISVQEKETHEDRKNFFAEAKEGLIFVASDKAILTLISIIAIAHFFVGSLQVVAPLLANELSGSGILNLSYLETAMGVGIIAGSLFAGLLKSRLRFNYLYLFLVLAGFSFALIGFLFLIEIRTITVYLLIFMTISILIVNASILWQSQLQTYTPNAMAGRVFSVASLAGNVSLPISFAVSGLLLDYLPISFVLLSGGGCLLLLGIYFSTRENGVT